MPLVTVAMPVYNAEKYIEKAINNIQRQSLTEFKFIISDNASTDSTGEVISRLAAQDPRITYYRQPHNMGAVANFAFVASKADTPYVVLAAHDDKWSDNYLEALCAEIQKQHDADIVVPTVVLEHADGTIYKTVRFDEKVLGLSPRRKAQGLLRNVTGSWFYGMYKRDALQSAINSIIEYNYAWASDIVALTPFILNGTIVSAPAGVFYHVETGISRQVYRPNTLKERCDIYYAFAKRTLRSLWHSPLPASEKILMLPFIVGYVGKHACKMRRIIRTALFPKSAERVASRKLTIR